MTAAGTPGAIGRTPRQVAGPEVDRLREPEALDDDPDADLAAPAERTADDAVDDGEVDGPEPDATETVDPEPVVATDPDPDSEPEVDPEPVVATDPEPEPEGFMVETDELRRRWESVQASFVDDPRRAVEQADGMVSAAVAALQAHIEQRREDLAETWRDGEQASTDTLITAFQRYRDLFDGVLST